MTKETKKTLFDAHVYVTVRVKVSNIEADSAEEVAEHVELAVCAQRDEWFGRTLGQIDIPGYGVHPVAAVEFAEEVSATLVDHAGEGGELVEVVFDRARDAVFATLTLDGLKQLLRQRADLTHQLLPYLTEDGKTELATHVLAPTPAIDLQQLRVGQEVWWMDPDHGKSSGYYQLKEIAAEPGEPVDLETLLILQKNGGSETEVYAAEIQLTQPASEVAVFAPDMGNWVHAGYACNAEIAIGCGSDYFKLNEMLHASCLTHLKPNEHPLAMAWVVTQDPMTPVTSLDGKPDVWFISQRLTDNFGDVNMGNEDTSPLQTLWYDQPLLERLIAQMWDEATFVVRKDGNFGLLYEVEFFSRESESCLTNDPVELGKLNSHADVVARLTQGLKQLQLGFPQVDFCVPAAHNIIQGRPAAWAFAKDGLLNKEQRCELGMKMLSLEN